MKRSKRSPGRQDACLWVRVKPRSSRNRILGWTTDGYLEIQLAAVPEKGKANQACLKEVARVLGVSRDRVLLEKGLTSRHKKIRIQGVSEQDARALLTPGNGKEQ